MCLLALIVYGRIVGCDRNNHREVLVEEYIFEAERQWLVQFKCRCNQITFQLLYK
jgi:hypothetical protein